MTFHDYYSARATVYARARPTYPPALFAHLAGLCIRHDLAWDCGTGNGQAARGLVGHFRAVVATDPSAAQIAEASPHARIAYHVAAERASGLAPASTDLVTAAQAAHWFDPTAFAAEVRRVLRPGGVVAAWCYGLCHITPAVDELLERFYHETVGPYWPPARRLVETGYRTLAFPFPELPFPSLVMEHWWTLRELAAYVRSWSAVARFTQAHGADPIPPLLELLGSTWGPAGEPRRVRWPLAGRIGRVVRSA